MGKFTDLGVPVQRAAVFKSTLGPDGNGEMTRIYAVFTQNAAPVFLVQIDPYTGEARQFNAPLGTHPWGLTIGPDKCVYIGTAGDEKQGGLLLKFDPRDPDKGLVNLGKMAASETYVWALAAGEGDDCIYGCSYGNGKITSYNTKTGEMRDFGQMRPGQQYTRPIVVGKDGWVYTAAGTTDTDYIALDPRTGEHHSSRPAELSGTPVPELAKGGWGQFRKGTDGHAYQKDNGKWYRLVAGKAEAIADADLPPAQVLSLKDGRQLAGVAAEGVWTLRDPATGQQTSGEFTYKSEGMEAFVIGEGPDGCIYGSTMLPLWLFRTDPRTGKHEVLGNPTPGAGGELYSMMALDGKLWVFAYPNAVISCYDPSSPWEVGRSEDSNPREFGRMGDGHLRPRALILGPERKLYVGSYAPYGELGGAMGVFDPVEGKVIENYRNLVPNQSISALAYDPQSGLVFGGSDISGGGGTAPSEKRAVFFVWDPVEKKLEQTLPLSKDTNVSAMTVAEGKVFFVSRPSNELSVFDIQSGQIVGSYPIPYGAIVEVAMGLHTDGMIYALTRTGVVRIDPKTCEIVQMAKYEGRVRCGFVMNQDGIYFASGVHLVKWSWPEG